MDLETVSADTFGRSLTGIGLNLLTRDVRGLAGFLSDVFGLSVHRLSDDFAIVRHGQLMLQLHADATFAAHPLPGLIPENPPRGGGVQLYLFGIDPDAAIARAARQRATPGSGTSPAKAPRAAERRAPSSAPKKATSLQPRDPLGMNDHDASPMSGCATAATAYSAGADFRTADPARLGVAGENQAG